MMAMRQNIYSLLSLTIIPNLIIHLMHIDRPLNPFKSYKYAGKFVKMIIIMTLLLAILIVFTISKCEANCTNHNEYCFSCLYDGSLYCCKDQYITFYAKNTCPRSSLCQFDYDQCKGWLIGTCIEGGLLLVGIGVMIVPMRRRRSGANQQNDNISRDLQDGFMGFQGEKTNQDRTDSRSSSTFDPNSIN